MQFSRDNRRAPLNLRAAMTRALAASTLLATASAIGSMAHAATTMSRPQHYRVVVLPVIGGPLDYLAGYLWYAPFNHLGTVAIAGYNAAETVSTSYTWTHGATTEVESLPPNSQGSPAGTYINRTNQWGLSAGYATRTNSASGKSTDNAVVWLPGGEVIDIADEAGTQSHAVWLNDLGEVSGWIENSTADPCSFGTGYQTQGVIWEFGVQRYLGSLGGPASYGEFIDDLGQVSGHAQTSAIPNSVTGCPPYDPFIWQDGKMVDINPGNFGGAEGGTNSLSHRGAAVGFGTEPGEATSRAFLWKSGKFTDLTKIGSLGGNLNTAFTVNEHEHVVGVNGTADGSALHAVLWRDGKFTDLSTLPGDDCSQPYGINDRDQIVGWSFSCATGSAAHAFLWQDGIMRDLNALIPSDSGIELQQALTIREDGAIAAQAVLSMGADAGSPRAVLLIPDGECSDAELQASAASRATASVQADAFAGIASTSTIPQFGGNGKPLSLQWLRPSRPGVL